MQTRSAPASEDSQSCKNVAESRLTQEDAALSTAVPMTAMPRVEEDCA